MSTVAATSFRPLMPEGYSTIADLLDSLGSIPAYRIWMQPPPGHATEEDAILIQERYGRLCELIDGTLVEKAMGVFESQVAIILAYFLEGFRYAHDLGIVLGADGMYRLFPKQIRIPDVSFVSWKRMPNEELPSEKVPSLSPDLAVEILSAGNTEEEMDRKLKEYFRAGTKLVWYVDPQARTVRVFTSPLRSKLLSENDTLDGGKVLPGFSLSIKKWFQRASRKPRR
jgi:Uma2 family endonuclease